MRRLLSRLRRSKRSAAPPPPELAPLPPVQVPDVPPGPWQGLHAPLRGALAPLLAPSAGSTERLHADLYGLPVLHEQACTWLIEELHAHAHWAAREQVDIRRPNSMNDYGVTLEQLGLEGLAQQLLTFLAPLARTHFPELGPLDHQHAFLVEYGAHADRDLGFHADDSEVTLNLCLGRDFRGGTLYFEGRRCEQHRQTGCSTQDRFDYPHEPGRALLHAGAHRHGARWLEAGHRVNLILWARSSTYRDQRDPEVCPDWCARSRAL